MSFVERLDLLMQTVGPSGYGLLGLAAAVEYLIPPFPGDTIGIFGGAYVARDQRSWPLVLVCMTFGSFVGIAINWAIGRALGRRLDGDASRRILPGVTVGDIQRLRGRMAKHANIVLLLNRFVPSARAFIPLTAGAAGISLTRTLVLATTSSLIWNAVLIAVGIRIGTSAERIAQFVTTWRNAVLAVAAVVAGLLVARMVWRRLRSRPPPASGTHSDSAAERPSHSGE